MSEGSYLRVEEHFNLPPATLYGLTNESGMFSRFLDYDEKIPGKLLRTGIVIKACQKYQIGNYGLSMSHDFTTGITTGLLHGTGVMLDRNDFPAWQDSPSVELFDLIGAVPHLWNHPMLLLRILLQHHLYRTERFCTIQLSDRANDLQHKLGMSRAFRMHGLPGPCADPAADRPIKDTKVNLHNLTGEMNTFISEIIWFTHVSDWQCDAINFLSRTLNEVAKPPNLSAHTGTKEIRECIEYLDSAAKGLRGHNIRERERVQADFNVLCTLIAQIDTRLTAKMAATSSRDSSAMKTLAFITTLFLPGTFVATIFSTGLFNWQASSPSPPRLLSPYFWIYWAFTIPLTLLVAFSWRMWWAWEKRHLDHDVLLQIENIEDSAASVSLQDGNEKASVKGELRGAWQALRRRTVKKEVVEKES